MPWAAMKRLVPVVTARRFTALAVQEPLRGGVRKVMSREVLAPI